MLDLVAARKKELWAKKKELDSQYSDFCKTVNGTYPVTDLIPCVKDLFLTILYQGVVYDAVGMVYNSLVVWDQNDCPIPLDLEETFTVIKVS